MAIEIYWFSGSPSAWRTLLAAELKGVTYTSRLISASKAEHRTPTFLALNPRAKVPVLRDGDVVIAESLATIAYLERRFPDPPLLGRVEGETGRIWAFVLDFDNNARPCFATLSLAIFFDRVDQATEPLRTEVDAVRRELNLLEKRLGGQKWLFGENISAADIAVYPHVEGLLRAAGRPAAGPLELGLLPLSTSYPALAAWRDRIIALPAYAAAYPPHWRDADRADATP
jgi:glutathione S-transferase